MIIQKKNRFITLVQNPFVILVSIILGILSGIYFKNYALTLAVFGDIYLSLLKMCVVPIMLTAIISSVGRLFESKGVNAYIRMIVIVFASLLIFTSLAGLIAGFVGQPGAGLSTETQATLGIIVKQADQKVDLDAAKSRSLIAFVTSMIPVNIFNAIASENSLQILFFAVMLGIASGLLPKEYGGEIISLADALFNAFFYIINWIMYLLPLGLFCLIASQIAQTGTDILFAMVKFIAMIYATCFFIILFFGVLICYSTGSSYPNAFLKLKECMIIAFGTQSTFASMPYAIKGLSKGLKVDAEIANLVIPIGAVICRFSMIILYSVAVVFTSQLYMIPLGPGAIIEALFLSVIAAIAGAGTPGIVSIAMISIVLAPLKLPAGAIIVLLLAINPVVEPVTTMANIYANCTATAVIARFAGRKG